MTQKNKTTFVLLGVVAAAVAAVLGMCCNYPSEWKTIHVGDTHEEVRRKCAGAQTGLMDVKGDFFSAGGGPVRWSLQVLYGSDKRVTHAHLALHIGTKNIFKRIHVKDLAIPR